MTYQCLICNEKKTEKRVRDIYFLWNDRLTSGLPICKDCSKILPIIKFLWKRFRYTSFNWEYEKLVKKRKKELREKVNPNKITSYF